MAAPLPNVVLVLAVAAACLTKPASGGSLRSTTNRSLALSAVDVSSGRLRDNFVLTKKFKLGGDPGDEFVIENHSDEMLTHSCSNYVNDSSTVFTRDGKLVLKVSSLCAGGGCMNSGRVMSKDAFRYGLFTFSAKVPKCNYVWPALWLLPKDQTGQGAYGTWPCSGEIDILETVHDSSFGSFNIVAGYGSSGGCWPTGAMQCNTCTNFCTSTTMDPMSEADKYFVEHSECKPGQPSSWQEHTFVMNWQPDELTTWVDPILSYDDHGRLIAVTPQPRPWASRGLPTWRSYRRPSTPTWLAVQQYMETCFADGHAPDAPFDDKFNIVLNIAVGGYGGAPCMWGSNTCGTTCGGAVGSELILSDISVWERAQM